MFCFVLKLIQALAKINSLNNTLQLRDLWKRRLNLNKGDASAIVVVVSKKILSYRLRESTKRKKSSPRFIFILGTTEKPSGIILFLQSIINSSHMKWYRLAVIGPRPFVCCSKIRGMNSTTIFKGSSIRIMCPLFFSAVVFSSWKENNV